MESFNELTLFIAEAEFNGHTFNCLPFDGEQEVLQVLVSDLDEIPVYVTVTEEQILCIGYLFNESEIREEQRPQLHEQMLEANVAMPLSSFAQIGNQYAVYGALSRSSKPENILREIVVLAQNARDALEALEEYLA